MKNAVRDHATEFYDEAEAMAIEDTIWWTRGRRAILRRFLDRAATLKIDRILEIGCGSGGDLPLLSRYGAVWGLEPSATLASRARRGAALGVHQADFFHHDIDPRVNLFCLFDVLEHIEYDEQFVKRLVDAAARDHLLLLSVPACQFLFGPHDRILHHYRRYSRRGITELLQRHGYEIVRSGYFMFLLFPLAVLSRFMERLKAKLGIGHSDVNMGRVGRPLNWVFTKTLELEAVFGRFVQFPIGLWVVVLARRKSDSR